MKEDGIVSSTHLGRKIERVLLILLNILLLGCQASGDGRSLWVPKRVEITAIYHDVLSKPILNSGFSDPEIYRFQNKWIVFVPMYSKLYILDENGERLYEKSYTDNKGFLNGGKTFLHNPVLNSSLYENYLYLIYSSDKVTRINLNDFEERDFILSTGHTIKRFDNCLITAKDKLLISLPDFSEEFSCDLLLIDLAGDADKLVYSSYVKEVPAPYMIVRDIGGEISKIELNNPEVTCIEMNGNVISEVPFKNPEEFFYRATPRLYTHQIGNVEPRLMSDKYIDFYINNDKLYVLCEIMSRKIDTRGKSEMMVAISDLHTGEFDSFWVDKKIKKFANDGTFFIIEEVGDKAFIKNFPLDSLSQFRLDKITYPF